MDRLYGIFRCNICNRPSELGWVYVCTQDDKKPEGAGKNPLCSPSASETQTINLGGMEKDIKYGGHQPEHTEPALDEPSFVMPTAELSPWIEKAIAEGHYTPAMIDILRAQKQHVVDVAKAAVADFDDSQGISSTSTQTSTSSESEDSNMELPAPLIKDGQNPPTSSLPSANNGPFAEPKLTMFPHCKFLACQVCRPTFKDRVWQHFENIFTTPSHDIIPVLDSTYRPLASLSIMRTIGLRPSPRGRPRLRHSGSKGLYSFDAEGRGVFSRRHFRTPSLDSTDIAEGNMDIEDDKGFKRNIKRTLKGMLASRNRPRSGRKRKPTKESSTSEEDAVEGDMGLWQQTNDALLDEAARVPLPMVEGDGLADGEKERDVGGVAVMEEAAEMGEADIIMSV